MALGIGGSVRRTLAFLLRPAFRLLLRYYPLPDPWDRVGTSVSLIAFGGGSRRDFCWYFEGESTIRVRCLEDVQRWLRRCTYASDLHLFQEDDFWQHPRTFEHLRRGDCEDFALWAWRKLVELGYDADFVVGCTRPGNETDAAGEWTRHAWIVFRREGIAYVYEPAERDRTRAIRELEAVRDLYLPEVGVGPDRRTFAFGGYLRSLCKRIKCD